MTECIIVTRRISIVTKTSEGLARSWDGFEISERLEVFGVLVQIVVAVGSLVCGVSSWYRRDSLML